MKKTIIYGWTVIFFILLIRIPLLSIPFFNVDEGSSAVIGNTILDGKIMYRDAVDGRGPLVYFTYAAIFSLAGKNNMTAVHLGLACLILFESVILYLISNLIYGRKTLLWTALFLGVFSYFPGLQDKLALHGEWVSIAFTALGSYFFLRYIYRNKYRYLFFSGFFFGMAFFSKQLALLDYAGALLFCSLYACMIKKGPGGLIKSLGFSALGFCTVALAFVLYFYFHNALHDFWFYFWGYYSKYYVTALTPLQKIKIAATGYAPPLFCFFGLLIFFINYRLLDNHKKNGKNLLIDSYIFCWLALSYIGASYSGMGFGHYYIMLIPPLCLLMTRVVQSVMLVLSFYVRPDENKMDGIVRPSNPAKLFLSTTLMICGAVLLLILYLGRNGLNRFYLNRVPQEALSSTQEKFNVPAEYIKEHSVYGQKIFVWGFHPEIYVLAQRMPASRYIYSCYLTGFISWVNSAPGIDTSQVIVPGSWVIFMRELRSNMPVYIVDTAVPYDFMAFGKYPVEKYEELFSFLRDNYTVERIFLDKYGFVSCRLFRKNQ